jgi:hypothetical protein
VHIEKILPLSRGYVDEYVLFPTVTQFDNFEEEWWRGTNWVELGMRRATSRKSEEDAGVTAQVDTDRPVPIPDLDILFCTVR